MAIEFFVPEGWTRGHPLRCMGRGPRYALFQAFVPELDFDKTVITAKTIHAIEFTSMQDVEDFLDWWHAPHGD